LESKIGGKISGKLKKIFIVTEGGKNIGLGHVRRCLVIAQELQKRDMDVLFLVNEDSSAIEWIKNKGFHYKISFCTKLQFLNAAGPRKSLVVIDTKRPVATFIRALKSRGYKTVLMDNITNARLEADSVIYPTAIYENNMDWKGFKGTIYGGAKYIPIARSFIEMRKQAADKKLRLPYQVLVTMGGSDPNQLTGKIVAALLMSQVPMHIRVAIGPAFSSDHLLDSIANRHQQNVQFVEGKDDLSTDMAESHVAITALGTTIFELACMGVPAIIVANYKSDEMDMIAFKKLGIALPLGYHALISDFQIRETMVNLLENKGLWGNMSQKGKMLIDCNGAERIADIVEKLCRISEATN
jgi:UDP-2,4-diacetamido-2,4,6-trideoxy-beta-L-altropyranose hydrolase